MQTLELVAGACYRLIRERTFTGNQENLVEALMQLRAERATGRLTIDLSQGGINRVRFREEQDIHHDEK